MEDYDVGYISGMIHHDPETDLAILERTSSIRQIQPSILPPLSLPSVASSATATNTNVASPSVTAITNDEKEGKNVLPPLPSALFIGDLRLTILKASLEAISVPCHFASEGVLLCGPAPGSTFNFISTTSAPVDPRLGAKAVSKGEEKEMWDLSGGRVAVRKLGRGRLVLEGGVGETWGVVRRKVYELHAAAG